MTGTDQGVDGMASHPSCRSFWFHNFSLKLLPDSILRRFDIKKTDFFLFKTFIQAWPWPFSKNILSKMCWVHTANNEVLYKHLLGYCMCCCFGLPLGCSPTLFILFPVGCSITLLTIVKEESMQVVHHVAIQPSTF